jgi:anti-sigma factor RsiW
MTCGDLEILLPDYLEGTLADEQARSLEAHLADCPACAELARDARLAMAFMGRARTWSRRGTADPDPG